MSGGWIGVDLDGTLFNYNGWKGIDHIGEPVPLMLERVKRWVAEGRTVKIFTARISHKPEREACIKAIQDKLEASGLPRLEVTNEKDFGMVELYDDRCVQVKMNTGEVVGAGSRGLAFEKGFNESVIDCVIERQRQINEEKFTSEADDSGYRGRLARAGAVYAIGAWMSNSPSAWVNFVASDIFAVVWPWEKSWWKPKSFRSMLVKAGALILAEIDRFDRLKTSSTPVGPYQGLHG